MKRGIKHFSKSSSAKYHLKFARKTFRITRGLEAVGKTRFVTNYHSGKSLLRCFRAIRALCDKGIVKIKVS
jgi:hypothetical protein